MRGAGVGRRGRAHAPSARFCGVCAERARRCSALPAQSLRCVPGARWRWRACLAHGGVAHASGTRSLRAPPAGTCAGHTGPAYERVAHTLTMARAALTPRSRRLRPAHKALAAPTRSAHPRRAIPAPRPPSACTPSARSRLMRPQCTRTLRRTPPAHTLARAPTPAPGRPACSQRTHASARLCRRVPCPLPLTPAVHPTPPHPTPLNPTPLHSTQLNSSHSRPHPSRQLPPPLPRQPQFRRSSRVAVLPYRAGPRHNPSPMYDDAAVGQ